MADVGRSSNRLDRVDSTRAIALVLVVLLHTNEWVGFSGIEGDVVFERLVRATEGLRMPPFFLVAGLFAGRWIHQRSWRELVNGKLVLLVWTYLVWQVAMFAYKYSAAIWLPDQRDTSLTDHLLRAVAAPVRPNAELWFLWALVLFFVAAKVVRAWPSLLVVVAAAAASVAWSTLAMPRLGSERIRLLGGAGLAPMYCVFFVLGERYRSRIVAAIDAVRWWQAGLITAGWVGIFVVAGASPAATGLPGGRFVDHVLGLVACIAVGVLLAGVAAVRHLGRNTLPVYLSHTTFIVFFAISYHLVRGNRPPPSTSVLPWLVAAGAIVLGLVLHRLAARTLLFRAPGWFHLPTGSSGTDGTRSATDPNSVGGGDRDRVPSGRRLRGSRSAHG